MTRPQSGDKIEENVSCFGTRLKLVACLDHHWLCRLMCCTFSSRDTLVVDDSLAAMVRAFTNTGKLIVSPLQVSNGSASNEGNTLLAFQLRSGSHGSRLVLDLLVGGASLSFVCLRGLKTRSVRCKTGQTYPTRPARPDILSHTSNVS